VVDAVARVRCVWRTGAFKRAPSERAVCPGAVDGLSHGLHMARVPGSVALRQSQRLSASGWTDHATGGQSGAQSLGPLAPDPRDQGQFPSVYCPSDGYTIEVIVDSFCYLWSDTWE
jgi:hypothetical protein